MAPARRTAHLPAHLSLAEGATIPIAAASAASSLVDVVRVKAGDKVVVNGGSGSVGAFAIQFVRHLGGSVAATCSTRNLDYVRSRGAARAIDYTAEDVLSAIRDWAPEGVDVIIDAVGQHSLPADTPDVVKPGGTLVCITNLITGTEAFDTDAARRRGVHVVDNVTAARTADPADFQVAAFHQLLEGVTTKAIVTPPYQVLPLDQAAAAHDRVEAGHELGKLLLRLGDV